MTVLTELATTLSVMDDITSPTINPIRYPMYIPLSGGMPTNMSLSFAPAIIPTIPAKRPIMAHTMFSALLTKLSVIIVENPLAWNKVMTFFPASR
eukprot:CAMPEP_0172505408 /NCGR_PEP_ID=MMETSP1066-20121228/186197_1 /TAXON_ID=671091 /ORGANISM="Coscinodiscus wailesii, Strain CCMP2513" /LENGTH=94 /DNA_ID=CAMNT_0013282005 /DNA_START=316 /DNA_END=600 /DNA_ORIENTATION=+